MTIKLRVKIFRFLFIFYFIILMSPSYSVQLFQNFEIAGDYNELLNTIKYGDEIKTTTKTFRVYERLDVDSQNRDKGNWSAVFRIQKNKVIKIPKNVEVNCEPYRGLADDFGFNEDFGLSGRDKGISKPFIRGNFKLANKVCLSQKALTSFFKGYQILADSGVPVIQVYDNESQAQEVVVVEDLGEGHFTAQEYFTSDSKMQLDNRNEDFFLEKLKIFFLKTWRLEYIGDFSSLSQVGWDGQQWKLIDWDNTHRIYKPKVGNNTTVIEYIASGLNSDLYPVGFKSLLLSWQDLILDKRMSCLNNLIY